MDPLKEMFNKPFYQHFARCMANAAGDFNTAAFVRDVTKDIDQLSLNGRLRNTSVMLRKYLPADYRKAVKTLLRASPSLNTGYTSLVLPDFVALYGKDHFDLSMEALKHFTTLGSAEFAIRGFLNTDLPKTLAVMHRWAEDKNEHVRRLASEGSRPRLPWSFKLDAVIRDPTLTAGILERLKADESLYVRKSVANHLNDISKDNTAYMLQLVKGWDLRHPHTGWIIKHANRTLIKKGHPDSLALFSFEKEVRVRFASFKISAPVIRLGETMQFEFLLTSEKNKPQKLVIDYAVHYCKSNGELSRKVFKLKETTLLPGGRLHVIKKQSYRDLTTRKHYTGKHIIEIIVNGNTMGSKPFRLIT